MKRFLVISLAIILFVSVTSYLAFRYYLASHRVARRVETQLQTFYGGPVRVKEVDVGLGSTSFNGFELFEEGNDDKKGDPWLKVASLLADVSLWELISGDTMPRKVKIIGAELVLRFDRAGRLLTRFPGQTALAETEPAKPEFLPEIEIDKSMVTFRKDGLPDLVVKNVAVRVVDVADNRGMWGLTGTGESAELGKLLLQGALTKDFKTTVHLKSAMKAHVTQSFLDRVPFVPASVWKEVQIEHGDTLAELTLTYDLEKKLLQYRLDLEPENVKLYIPAIDLSAKQAHGKVTVKDNLVLLRGVQGHAFGGVLRTEADLDFRTEPSKIKFTTIKVENLNINELPDDWNIPAVIRKSIAKGKLFGNATLGLSIYSGAPTPLDAATLVAMAGASPGFGSGDWYPITSLLAAFPIPTMQTRSQGKGEVRDSVGEVDPIEFDWQLAPRRARARKQESRVNQVDKQVAAENSLSALAVRNTTVVHFIAQASLLPFLLMQDPHEKPKPPSYLDMNLGLKNVNLAEIIKNLDLKLPISIEGNVSFHVKVSIPTDRADDFKAYKVHGSAQMRQLVLAGATLEDLSADLHFAAGILTLNHLKGRLPGNLVRKNSSEGTFLGTGQIQLMPLGELRADLDLDHLPIRPLAARVTDGVDGTFSGKLTLRVPVEKLQSVDSFEANGQITSDLLEVYGLSLQQISTSVRLKDGVLRVPDAQLKVEGAPVAASAELRLSGAYPFFVKSDLRNLNLTALQKLAIAHKATLPPLAGALTTSIDLQGKLRPFAVTASGDAQAQNVTVDTLEAQNVAFRWETDGDKLDLKNVAAMLYQGKVTGAAVVPFDPKIPGSGELRIHDIDVKQLAKDLRVPFRMDGTVDGLVKGTFSPSLENTLRTGTFHMDLHAPKMRMQNVPTQQLRASLEYRQGALDYKFEGKTLGGAFDMEGLIPSSIKPDALKKETQKSRLMIRNVQLARLFRALNLQNTEIFSGLLNLDVHYTHDTHDRYPEGRGVINLSNLYWNDKPFANNLQGDVTITDQEIRLRNLEGGIGQGSFRTQVTYNLLNPNRGWFTLNLVNVEASHLLAPWPDVKIEGPLDARIRGSLGSSWRGSANVVLSRGKVFGLEVMQWRLPSIWTFAPAEGRGHLDVYETGALVARGRASGALSLSWDSGARIKGALRLANVDLQDLLRQIIGPNHIGGGRLSAHFDFDGTDVRSLHDLSGKLTASFHQAQPLQTPVFRQLAPLLGVGASTTFQQGNLLAHLDRGILRIRQLALEGNTLQLFMDGVVTLEGRLNLSALAKTGDVGLPSARLGPISVRIPVAGPIPIALVVEASNLLSNRLMKLHIGGTLHNPIIQPRPVPILTQEAVRYFLNRSLPITINP